MDEKLQEPTSKESSTKRTPRYLWFIPFVVCFINILSGGSERSNSLLFVALMEEGDYGRLMASLPNTARSVAMIALGAVVIFLGSRMSFVSLGFLGVSLYASGRVFCYLSTDIYTVTIFHGLISGGGMMLLWTHLPAIINITLKEHKSTAMGIATLGLPLGGFFWPYITQYLLENYGLNGTFLMTAGISLHAFIGIALLSVLMQKQNFTKNNAANVDKNQSREAQVSRQMGTDINGDKKISKDIVEEESLAKSEMNAVVVDEPATDPEDEQEKQTKSAVSQKQVVFRMLSSHVIYLLSFTSSVNFYCQAGVNQVLADFLADKGIDRQSALVMITIFASGGIFGRLSLGWITDMHFISIRVMTAINMTVCGIAFLMTTYFTQVYVLWICYFIIGLCEASTFVTNWSQYSQYFEDHELITALSISRLITGLVLLSRSPTMGLFRDFLKSYDYFFRGSAGFLFIMSISWLFEEYRISKREKKYSKLNSEDPEDN